MKLQKTSAIMSLLFGSTFPQVQKDWPTLSSRFTTKMTTSHKQRITSCFDKNTNSNYPCLCENGYIDAIQKCRKTGGPICWIFPQIFKNPSLPTYPTHPTVGFEFLPKKYNFLHKGPPFVFCQNFFIKLVFRTKVGRKFSD